MFNVFYVVLFYCLLFIVLNVIVTAVIVAVTIIVVIIVDEQINVCLLVTYFKLPQCYLTQYYLLFNLTSILFTI